MAPRRVLAGCVIALALIGWSRPACGVVRLDYTVPKIYKTSNAVVVGTVAAVNPGNRVVDINVTATLKGASPGPRLRVQAAAPPDLFQKVAVGQSVVLFLAKDRGASVAIVHLADTWLLAKGLPGASKPAWRVTMPYRAARAFPGRTPSLVRLVRAIAAGANASQTESYPDAFLGGVRKLAELRVTPTDMAVLDLTDDGQPDLLVFTETGVCLFAARGSAYVDVTQASGLASAKGGRGATGDIDADGKTDLLLGRTLWRKGKSGFIQAGAPLDLPAPSTWAAAALDDATGDGRGDVVVLLKTGTLLTLANPAGRGGGWNKSARRLWEGHTARAAAFLVAVNALMALMRPSFADSSPPKHESTVPCMAF